MTNDIKTVVLRAPLLTKSGYGVHSRQVAKWLFDREDTIGDIKVYCQPVPWGINPWIIDTEYDDGLIGRIVQASQPVEGVVFDVSYQLQLPNEWNPFLANQNYGLTAAVEADRCNPQWIAACNKMDGIIVPSKFTKETLEATGELKVPLTVIPESYPCGFDSAQESNLDLELTTDFNFLVFGQITGNNPENDRKNLPYTIKWIYEAFQNNPNVGIVVKTNCGRLSTVDRFNSFNILAQLVQQLQKPNGPKVYLLHGDMSDPELKALYSHPKIKALVTLTRGEGFGLPMLEAARCGLPVVATGWSAHTEFLNLGKYVKVDYSLEQIHQSRVDGQIWLEGAKWAQPSEQDAKRKLKKLVESPRVPQEWASDLKDKVAKAYNFKTIADKYNDFFNEHVSRTNK